MTGNASETTTKTRLKKNKKPPTKEQRKIYNDREKVKRLKRKSDQLFNDPNLEETKDYLVCKVCNHAVQDMALHLKNHDMTMAQYREQYDKDAIAKPTNRTDQMKGENNPAYGHGGKYSPFSKKFIKGDISKETVEKSISNRTLRGNDTTTIEYYLKKGYTEEEAKVKLSERQTTFNLEKCIEKFGEVEGRKRWEERQKKWQDTLNAKSDEEKQEINRKKISKAGGKPSKAEVEIYDWLVNNGVDQVQTQYMCLNEETNSYYKLDFMLGNRVIEYQGDFWHANPNKYKADAVIYRQKTAQQLWDQDHKRTEYLKSLGYEVMIIWESEYKNDKKRTLERCKYFLLNK